MVNWPVGLFAVGRRAQQSAPEGLLGSRMPDTLTLTQKAHPAQNRSVCSTRLRYVTTHTWLSLHQHLVDMPCLIIFDMRWCMKLSSMTGLCKCPESNRIPNIMVCCWLQASIYKNGAVGSDNAVKGNGLPAKATLCIDRTCNLVPLLHTCRSDSMQRIGNQTQILPVHLLVQWLHVLIKKHAVHWQRSADKEHTWLVSAKWVFDKFWEVCTLSTTIVSAAWCTHNSSHSSDNRSGQGTYLVCLCWVHFGKGTLVVRKT